MTLGGIDVRLPLRLGANSMEAAVRAIRCLWPDAVFADGLTGERCDFWQIPFGKTRELFVYRDAAAAAIWDAAGAIPEANNTMLHLLCDEDLLTVVIDERGAEMEKILAAIQSALEDADFYAPACHG